MDDSLCCELSKRLILISDDVTKCTHTIYTINVYTAGQCIVEDLSVCVCVFIPKYSKISLMNVCGHQSTSSLGTRL